MSENKTTAQEVAERLKKHKGLVSEIFPELFILVAARHDALADEVRIRHNLMAVRMDDLAAEVKKLRSSSWEACGENVAASIEELRTRADDHQRRLEQIESAGEDAGVKDRNTPAEPDSSGSSPAESAKNIRYCSACASPTELDATGIWPFICPHCNADMNDCEWLNEMPISKPTPLTARERAEKMQQESYEEWCEDESDEIELFERHLNEHAAERDERIVELETQLAAANAEAEANKRDAELWRNRFNVDAAVA